MTTNNELIGRDEINDLEAILSVSNTDVDAKDHNVGANFDAVFTWDYERSRPALGKLYEKAKTSQWNVTTDLDWSTPVDQEALALNEMKREDVQFFGDNVDLSGTPFAKWTEKEWVELAIEGQNWTLSQFLHGEQGALLCTARIVETVPWIDAKYYAATQVVDEARHVEVFAKYLDEKLSGHYPINAHLELLLDDILADSRWDMTYLGMQIMVEGLALAAFGFMHQMTTEPLLKQLLRYVMSDEARHVAFGVLSLAGVLQGAHRHRDDGPPGVRVRGGRPHARPVPAARGLGPHGRAGEGCARARHGRRGSQDVPEHLVLEDRAELQEARPARPQPGLAAAALHRARRHPVRGLGRHRRGIRDARRGRQGPRSASRRRRVVGFVLTFIVPSIPVEGIDGTMSRIRLPERRGPAAGRCNVRG